MFSKTGFVVCGIVFLLGVAFGNAANASDTHTTVSAVDSHDSHAGHDHSGEGTHSIHTDHHEEHGEHEHVEETASHGSHAGEGYFDVMTDPAHFLAELTYEFVFFALSTAVLWWKLNRRDKAHGHADDGAHTHH